MTALVGRAQWKIDEPPSLRGNERAWMEHERADYMLSCAQATHDIKRPSFDRRSATWLVQFHGKEVRTDFDGMPDMSAMGKVDDARSLLSSMICKNFDLIWQVVSEHMLSDRQVSTLSRRPRPTAIRWSNRMTALSGSHGVKKKVLNGVTPIDRAVAATAFLNDVQNVAALFKNFLSGVMSVILKRCFRKIGHLLESKRKCPQRTASTKWTFHSSLYPPGDQPAA